MTRALGLVMLVLTASCARTPSLRVAPQGPSVEAARLVTPSGTIHGTLLVPQRGSQRVPVALLIAGSGPTDRDGNSTMLAGRNDSLRMVAEALAANGIASLRYDKRGIGESKEAGGAESDLRFDHLIADAEAWIGHLRRDGRFSTVTVIGHSEGSLIGMIAAHRAGADGVVSIAGAGRKIPDAIREQLRPNLPPELWEESERILDSLAKGETVAQVPPALAALYRPSVQPYLISWFAYEPAREIARLRVPVLIVQGTTDMQAGPAEAEALMAAAPHAELARIEGMNHVLKLVEGDRARQIASYSDRTLPVAPELMERVTNFIRGL